MSWRDHAACRGVALNVFFVEAGGTAEQARAICAGCPVKDECLAYALDEGDHLHGIFGGTTHEERRLLRRNDKPQRPQRSTAVCGTLGGVSRHQRNGEPVCDECRAAKTAYRRELRARKKAS